MQLCRPPGPLVGLALALALALAAPAACGGGSRATPPGPSDNEASDAPPPGAASLRVDVEPPEGITVWLDGERVATAAPFTSRALAPGAHSLYVRGMGYLPVTLPLELQAGQRLRVPVSLRARPQADEALPQQQASVTTVVPRRERSRPSPPPPDTPVELPPGVAPVELHLVPQPPAPIVLDGSRADGRAVRLHRARGLMQVGAMNIAYGIDGGRVLELVVPDDDAQWSKDGTELAGGTIIRLSYGVTRLRRGGAARQQVLLLRRAN